MLKTFKYFRILKYFSPFRYLDSGKRYVCGRGHIVSKFLCSEAAPISGFVCSLRSFCSFVCPKKLLSHFYATQEGEIWYVSFTHKYKINQGVLVGQSPFLGITTFSTVQHTSLHTQLCGIFQLKRYFQILNSITK